MSDLARVWWCRGAEVVPLPWAEAGHLVRDGRGVRAWLARGREVWAGPAGWGTAARRRSVPGPADAWRSDGFVYARHRGATRAAAVLEVGARWVSGPGGSLVGGDAHEARVGAIGGRTPRALPAPLPWPSLRFSRSGRYLAGLAQGRTVRVDLVRGAVAHEAQGVPVTAYRTLTDAGVVRHGERAMRRGVASFSPARWDELLAGPGGVVWSLRTGRPRFRTPALALGATVGTPTGFVTIDWQHARGWTVDPDSGATSHAFTLPLSPDDTVLRGRWTEGAVWLETALGACFRVVEGVVTVSDASVPRPPPVPPLATPSLGLLPVDGRAQVGPHHFGWTEDGFLWSVPAVVAPN